MSKTIASVRVPPRAKRGFAALARSGTREIPNVLPTGRADPERVGHWISQLTTRQVRRLAADAQRAWLAARIDPHVETFEPAEVA